MHVYVIESGLMRGLVYTGSTSDPLERLKEHNGGKLPHTAKHRPWKLRFHAWFDDPGKARRFEKYLKSASGAAFRNRHL
jgi:putative endonuclease